jgi:hypothetical protein
MMMNLQNVEIEEEKVKCSTGAVKCRHEVGAAKMASNLKCYDLAKTVNVPIPADYSQEYADPRIRLGQLTDPNHWLFKRYANLVLQESVNPFYHMAEITLYKRDPKNIETQRCSKRCEEKHHQFCPSIYTRESMWINAHIDNHRIDEQPDFWHNVQMYVKGRANGIRLMESFRRQGAPDDILGVQKIIDDLKHNFFSLYILGMNDDSISLNADPRFWIDLYYIREYLGILANFGNKNKYSLDSMTTEAPDWTPEWLNRLFANVKTTATTIADALKAVFDKVWSFMKDIFGFVSEAVNQLFQKLTSWLVKLFGRIVMKGLDAVIGSPRGELIRNGVIFIAVLFLFTIMQSAYLITNGMLMAAFRLVRKLGPKKTHAEKLVDQHMQAEGPASPTPTATLLGALIGAFGLSTGTITRVKNVAMTMSGLMVGGTVLASIGTHLFVMLPMTLRTALIEEFGTSEMKNNTRLELWTSRTLAVLQVQKVPSVMKSKVFMETVNTLLKEGTQLMFALKDPTRKSMMLGPFVRMGALASILTQYKNTPTTRQLPYSLHIYGPPGVGKTLIVPQLAGLVFDIGKTEIYNRSNSDPFWSGCADPDMVVMDEFLYGSAQDKMDTGKMYLSLCSTAQFQPPMASTDNITVGVKGTVISPRVVVTMNNTPLFHVEGLDATALNRRRQLVVETQCTADTRWKIGANGRPLPNNVDLAAYNREEIAGMIWLKFRIHPAIQHPGYIPDPNAWITKQELVERLRERYALHRETCENIGAAFGNGFDDHVNPEVLMNEVMRECYGIPVKSVGVKAAIWQLLGFGEKNDFAAEGSVDSVEELDGDVSFPQVWETKREVELSDKPGGSHLHACCGRVNFCNGKKTTKYKCPKCNTTKFCDDWQATGLYSLRYVSGLPVQGPRFSIADPTIPTTSHAKHKGAIKLHAHKCAHLDCPIRLIHEHDLFGNTTYHEPFRCEIHREEPKYTTPAEKNANTRSDDALSAEFRDQTITRLSCVVTGCTSDAATRDDGPTTCTTHRNMNATIETLVQQNETTEIETKNLTNTEYYNYVMRRLELLKGETPDVIADALADAGMMIARRSDIETAAGSMIFTGMKIGALVGLFAIAIEVLAGMFVKEEAESLTFGVESPPAKKDSKNRSRPRKTFSRWTAQGSEEFPKSVTMTYQTPEGWIAFRAFPLKDNLYLTYFHSFKRQLYSTTNPRIKIRYTTANQTYDCELVEQLAVVAAEYDLLLFSFNNRKLPPNPNNLKKFATRAMLDLVDVNESVVQIVMDTSDGKKYTSAKRWSNLGYQDDVADEGGNYKLPDAWRYYIPTEKGDCGSVIVAVTGHMAGLIIGMHVAGTRVKGPQAQGAGPTLMREEIEDMIKALSGGTNFNIDTTPDLVTQGDTTPPATTTPPPTTPTIPDYEPDYGSPIFYNYDTADEPTRARMLKADFRRHQLAHGAEMTDEEKTNLDMAFAINAVLEDVPAEEAEETMTFVLKNMVYIKPIAKDTEISQSPNTKLRPSLLHSKLKRPSIKTPAVLSRNDPRAGGRDPRVVSMFRTLNRPKKEIDENLIREVFEDMEVAWTQNMKPPIRRRLTFEEACKGVPGLMSSLRVQTSPGYPLIKTTTAKGKKEYIWFDDQGEFHYDPEFRKMVDRKLREMLEYTGDLKTIDHVFIGYLKDELVSSEKILKTKTRMIYSNDLICLVAFRMIYGPFLIMLQNSKEFPSAIGVNQYSYEMNAIYEYLIKLGDGIGNRFYDGDLQQMDINYAKAIRRPAYEFICDMTTKITGKSIPSQDAFMIDHETETPAQVGSYQFKTDCNNFSGCFFTTPLNCVTLEAYFRICFKVLCPGLNFDENIRVKLLGDDHILWISPAAERAGFVPRQIARVMKDTLGQKYTDADKTKEVGETLKVFSDLTFLGAQPTKLYGLWTGAMKQDTIYQTMQWKTTPNEDFPTVRTMLDYATVWGKDFYEELYEDVTKTYREAGIDDDVSQIRKFNWKSRSKEISDRMDGDYLTFVAEGPGLLTATAAREETSSAEPTTFDVLASKAVNAAASGTEYGLESQMYRGEVVWTAEQPPATKLSTLLLPRDVLALGNPDNVQNMAFQRYIYTTHDLLLTFEITGNPSQQGKVIVYENPLGSNTNPAGTEIGLQDIVSLFQMNHITLEPNRSSTQNLLVKFKSFRSALNTFSFIENYFDCVGSANMVVVSPLRTLGDAATATITMRSSFHRSRFAIPRPIPAAGKADPITGRRYERFSTVMSRVKTSLTTITKQIHEESRMAALRDHPYNQPEFVTEGANVSTVNNTQTINISDVGGNVPYQGHYAPDTSGSQSLEQSATIPMPMHNPPLAGGAVPIFGQLPSMSRSYGLAPCTALQLHPAAMYREAASRIASEDLDIGKLLSKKFLWNKFTWATTDVPGTVLFEMNFNSLLSDGVTNPWDRNLNYQLMLLNSFLFFKTNFQITLEAVRTRFHAGKLMATINYGSPETQTLDRNVPISRVIDFSDDNYNNTLLVPWSAGTEFLRTVDFGAVTAVQHPVQDYSMGSLTITVMNQMQANDTVAQDIDVLVYMELNDPLVAELKEVNMRVYRFDEPTERAATAVEGDVIMRARMPIVDEEEPEFIAEGDVEVVQGTETPEEAITTPMTAQEANDDSMEACVVQPGLKFEHLPKNLMELVRRHFLVNVADTGVGNIFRPVIVALSTAKALALPETGPQIDASAQVMPNRESVLYNFMVRPRHQLLQHFAAWQGHMKYRIIASPQWVVDLNGATDKIPSRTLRPSPPVVKFVPMYMPTLSKWKGTQFNTFWPGAPTGFRQQGGLATEYMSPMGDGSYMIDIEVPFSTHFNMLPIVPSDSKLTHTIGGMSGVPGFISVKMDNLKAAGTWDIEVYEAVGDDFAVFGYQPHSVRSIALYANGTSPTVNGYVANGGYMF